MCTPWYSLGILWEYLGVVIIYSLIHIYISYSYKYVREYFIYSLTYL